MEQNFFFIMNVLFCLKSLDLIFRFTATFAAAFHKVKLIYRFLSRLVKMCEADETYNKSILDTGVFSYASVEYSSNSRVSVTRFYGGRGVSHPAQRLYVISIKDEWERGYELSMLDTEVYFWNEIKATFERWNAVQQYFLCFQDAVNHFYKSVNKLNKIQHLT